MDIKDNSCKVPIGYEQFVTESLLKEKKEKALQQDEIINFENVTVKTIKEKVNKYYEYKGEAPKYLILDKKTYGTLLLYDLVKLPTPRVGRSSIYNDVGKKIYVDSFELIICTVNFNDDEEVIDVAG